MVTMEVSRKIEGDESRTHKFSPIADIHTYDCGAEVTTPVFNFRRCLH